MRRKRGNTGNSPEQARKRTRYIFAIAFTAAVGGFLFGYDLSLIGAANIFLKEQFHLNAAALGFTTASAALGCVFGPFLGGWLCDAIGRERTMIVASLLLAVGAIMTALSQSIVLFNTFRILGGVGVGLCSVASPMYISEVAPHKMRGKLGMMYQLAIVVGSTAAPLVAYVLVRIFPDSVSWRWMFGSQMVVVILFTVFLFMLPPSPRWLVQKGRSDEAARVLNKVHGEGAAPTELREIKEAIEEEAGGLRELLLPGIRYAVLIGFLLAFFNNWTGWSVMGGYIPILFEMAGVTAARSDSAVLFYLLCNGNHDRGVHVVHRSGRASAAMDFGLDSDGWYYLRDGHGVSFSCAWLDGFAGHYSLHRAAWNSPWRTSLADDVRIVSEPDSGQGGCRYDDVLVVDHFHCSATLSRVDWLVRAHDRVGRGRFLAVHLCLHLVRDLRMEDDAGNQGADARRNRPFLAGSLGA